MSSEPKTKLFRKLGLSEKIVHPVVDVGFWFFYNSSEVIYYDNRTTD